MKKLKVIKKIIKTECWTCKKTKCKVCYNTKKWKEFLYYFIYKDKTGNLIAVDSNTLA